MGKGMMKVDAGRGTWVAIDWVLGNTDRPFRVQDRCT